MRKAQLQAMLCALLLAGAGALSAQESAPQVKGAARPRPAVMAAPGTHDRMMRLQAEAIAAAQQVERLSQASRLNRSAIREQGLKAQGDLQAVMHHLTGAEQHATGAQKQHVTAVRGHEQEALTHAQALCDGASKDPARVIGMHAQAVIEHARAAQEVMTSAATDSWMSTEVSTGKHL